MNINICKRWHTSRLALLFSENTQKNNLFSETHALQFKYGSLVAKKQYDLTDDLIDTYKKYTIIQPDDIIVNGLNLNYDFVTRRVALSEHKGIITSAYICLRPRKSVSTKFYTYYLKALDSMKVFNGMGTGIRLTLSYDLMKNMSLPVPPRDEQDQIVRYLDWQVSKINRLIAAKRKQIELLNQTIAHNLEQIICEGIHGEELVETGNPWISTAPRSWNKLRHKNILTEKKIVVGDAYSQYALLSLTTKGIIVRDISSGKGKFPSDFSTYQVVQPSDMVFCLFDVDETPRTVGLSTYMGMITGAYTVYETHDVLPEFLLHYFTVIDNKKGFKPLYSGLRKVIGKDVFARQSIYLPSVEEQKEIVAAIGASQKKCKQAMDLFEQEIIALADLRTRLISDVVTGQIDVRGIEIPDYERAEEFASPDNTEDESEDIADEEE